MINIIETSTFETTIPEVETTTPVLGGVGGESNQAVEKLTNRTRWLYDHLNAFDGIATVNSSVTIDNTYLRKLIYIDAADNLSLAIAALSTFAIGQKLIFKCKCPNNRAITFTPNGSEVFSHGRFNKSVFWLCDGEEMTLVKRSSTSWELCNLVGNFEMVGNDAMVRRLLKNTLIADGSLVLRVNHPRLFDMIESTAIDDATWSSDPLNYRCFFSLGDTVSNFRLPDMRAISWRGLDLGRGISLGRIGTGAGGYEGDEVKLHNHNISIPLAQHTSSGAVKGVTDGPAGFPLNLPFTSDNTGATENTIKTAGFIPVIYY